MSLTAIARILLAAVSIAVLAWLGTMERNERLIARGVVATGKLDVPGTVAQADADLRSARFLNPDTTPDLARALIFGVVRQPARAVAILERVLRDEPDNVGAWAQLLAVTARRDPVTARRARAELRRLDPVDARRR